jgi:hypothetical protein
VKEERMTDERTFVSNSTAVVILIAVVTLIGLLMYGAQNRAEQEEQRSCMDGVVAPETRDPQYDDKMLEFTAQIRKCLRG